MGLQLLESEAVDIQLPEIHIPQLKIRQCRLRKALYLSQLFHSIETSQALTVSDNSAGKTGTDTGNMLQSHRICYIESHGFSGHHLNRIAHGIAVVLFSKGLMLCTGLFHFIANADKRAQTVVFHLRQPIEAGKIGWLTEHTASLTVFIKIADLLINNHLEISDETEAYLNGMFSVIFDAQTGEIVWFGTAPRSYKFNPMDVKDMKNQLTKLYKAFL